MNEKKVLFYAESPVKYAMFRPVQERLAAGGGIRFYFAGQLRGRLESKAMARELGVTGATPIRRGLAALRRFDLFVTADYDTWSGFSLRGLPISRSPKLQIFHGVSMRNGALQPAIARFQHLFVVGPYMYRGLVEHCGFDDGDPRLHRVGMPKVDRLVDGSIDVDRVRRELGLDPSRPTVTLAPTWLRSSPFAEVGVELIERLSAGPWNLVIKLHDKYLDSRYNLVDWGKRLEGIAGRDNVVVPLGRYDAVPLLLATDVLITDASSIGHEFTLLDRPLVYLRIEATPKLLEQFPRLDLETWGQRAGEACSDAAGCVAAVERALSDPTRNGEIRRALARDVFFHPGQATEAAARATRQILGLERGKASESPGSEPSSSA